jgi:hypothetical protein
VDSGLSVMLPLSYGSPSDLIDLFLPYLVAHYYGGLSQLRVFYFDGSLIV